MDEIRAAQYIDFVYRQSCSCHILLQAARQNYANFEIAFPTLVLKSLQEQTDAQPSETLQCALINGNELRVMTINRRRNVALINRGQVTRIAHYYSRINVFRRYNVY